MSIKALDELRDYAEQCCPEYEPYDTEMMRIADEIQAELSERYMELPVDAHGVPIHVGDAIEYPNGRRDVVRFITLGVSEPTLNEGGWMPSRCYYVKPRTIEDVLRDCCNEWNEHCGDDWESGVYAKYADEIRELTGGGE